uniref:Uncharacterized protein n=1 Tax=Electrophorus electricus TaxID=8005 RepID=A0AAY5EIN1_ELEEL
TSFSLRRVRTWDGYSEERNPLETPLSGLNSGAAGTAQWAVAAPLFAWSFPALFQSTASLTIGTFFAFCTILDKQNILQNILTYVQNILFCLDTMCTTLQFLLLLLQLTHAHIRLSVSSHIWLSILDLFLNIARKGVGQDVSPEGAKVPPPQITTK